MRRLMADNEHIAKAQRAAIETCEDHHDSVTANLLQEVLDATERRKWYLFEVVQGSENTQ